VYSVVDEVGLEVEHVVPFVLAQTSRLLSVSQPKLSGLPEGGVIDVRSPSALVVNTVDPVGGDPHELVEELV
jgi:hypothetical protein